MGKEGLIICLRLSFRLKRRQKYKIFKMRPIITRCTVTVITLSFIFRLKRATRHLIQNKLAFNVIIECTVMTSYYIIRRFYNTKSPRYITEGEETAPGGTF